jgi:hypothetical protein
MEVSLPAKPTRTLARSKAMESRSVRHETRRRGPNARGAKTVEARAHAGIVMKGRNAAALDVSFPAKSIRTLAPSKAMEIRNVGHETRRGPNAGGTKTVEVRAGVGIVMKGRNAAALKARGRGSAA